jgi:hypothetical protein
MATNNFYTDESRLSSALAGDLFYDRTTATLHVATGTGGLSEITSPQFTTIEAHGVKYKTQTFEDRPTVFGSPLRIQWSVSDVEVLNAQDAHTFASELMRVNAQKLKMAIAHDCADCLNCPKCDIKVQQHQDDIRQRTNFIMQASCKSDRHTAHMTMCPNGKAAVVKGSTALVPDLAMMPQTLFTDISTTMVPTPEPQPYMRPTSPDTPMTAADEAW